MTNFSENVKINEYFKRSVNIKTEKDNIDFIKGFICPKSSENALMGLVNHVQETGQSSFTWTGPYGSGKSSLVVLLSTLISDNEKTAEIAFSKISEDARLNLKQFFSKDKWGFIPIIGEPEDPVEIISEALVANGVCKKRLTSGNKVIEAIEAYLEKNNLVIVVDEMGKFLEGISRKNNNSDIYIFQQLAELANSSKGKLVLIGVLHQSFGEYSRNLSRVARDEWTKIQGRYVDYSINAAGEEQIELISKAIISDKKPKKVSKEAIETAKVIDKNRPVDKSLLQKTLNDCWPLHPVVASLLGPTSRRRFGQNQRSIFSFLNSAEPGGFKDFLKNNEFSNTNFYFPSDFWDYIQLNLESSIVASSDSKLWAQANESLARCKVLGGESEHIKLLKTICVIDIFKGTSGLVSSVELLEKCGFSNNLANLLQDLEKWSLVKFKKFSNSYSIFEGSDFDIEFAIDDALKKVDSINFSKLSEIASFKPFVAKRHYHEFGALRWMNIEIVPFVKAKNHNIKIDEDGAFGSFIIIIPENEDDYEDSLTSIKKISKSLNKSKAHSVICGVIKNYKSILSYGKELLALEWIEKNSNEMLDGDSVARREVETRKALITSLLQELLSRQLSEIEWFENGNLVGVLSSRKLVGLVSDLADSIFNKSPIVKSEMLNRDKPSSNANAALNSLLKSLIVNSGKERLGISGYPPEGGLFKSLLEDSNLYLKKEEWCIEEPTKNHKLRFNNLWEAADKTLSKSPKSLGLNSLFEVWSKPPYGVKSGLLPFFSIAYLMTRKNKIALYLNDTYRASIDDLFLDYLLKTPQTISLRWVDYDSETLKILELVRNSLIKTDLKSVKLDSKSSAFETAKSLVTVVDNLNSWVHRTRNLSKETIKIRELIKSAHDPNKLLFDDLPRLLDIDLSGINQKNSFSDISYRITKSLNELINAYPNLMNDLGSLLMSELQVGLVNEPNLQQLRKRAKNIQGASGDFRTDALAARLSNFEVTEEHISGIASLAANKPVKDWIDLDVERAKKEIVSLCAGFKKAELLARVNGRKANRHALALIAALPGEEKIMNYEFDLLETELEAVQKIKDNIYKSLTSSSLDGKLALAAITELGSEYIEKLQLQDIEKDKLASNG